MPMGLGRREFLKKSAVAVGASAVGIAGVPQLAKTMADEGGGSQSTAPSLPVLTPDGQLIHVDRHRARPVALPRTDPQVRVGIPGRKWVMVIDLASCDGCGKCTEACQSMHGIPSDREWITVLRMQDAPGTAPYWFPKPCFHCDNPPCTKVCPVDATFKRQDGIVLVDNARCIGCRFCMAACPYSARSFNWSRPQPPPEGLHHTYSPEQGSPRRVGTAEKCDFCPDMARVGELPACVASCAMGTIYFGDENEDAVTNSTGETVQLSALLHDRAGYRYMEDLGTEPRVYYLPPKDRRYPAPDKAPHQHTPGHHP